ncbi:MAG: hypothetical protein KKD35_08015, partial [Elusimicrobia bacterium]|nr:hypothetical protein [Elusimicrobiota bacterium]
AADRDVIVTGIANAGDFALISNVNASNSGFNVEGAAGGTLKKVVGGATLTSPDIRWAIKMPVGEYRESTNNINLKHFEADKYQVGGVTLAGLAYTVSDNFWYARENYVINNGGNIAKTDDFTSSGEDPFSVLKEHAFETVMYIKSDSRGVASADYFNVANTNYGNIDMVIIPDLGVAAIQRMLPILSSLSD